MTDVDYTKERELARHIVDKYIRKALNTAHRKGYSGLSPSSDFSKPAGRQVPGTEDLRYVIRRHDDDTYQIVLDGKIPSPAPGEAQPGDFYIDLTLFPSLFSRYVRGILTDMEQTVSVLPRHELAEDLATHRNLRKAITIVDEFRDTHPPGSPSVFPYGLFGFMATITPAMDQVNKVANNLTPSIDANILRGLHDGLQDERTSVHDIISEMVPDELTDDAYSTLLPLLPFLDENALLLHLARDPEFVAEMTTIDMAVITRHLEERFADLQQSLPVRFGDMSRISKSKQVKLFRSLAQTEYRLHIPLPGTRAVVSLQQHTDTWSSPLLGAAPSGQKPKLLTWDGVGIHLFTLLAGQALPGVSSCVAQNAYLMPSAFELIGRDNARTSCEANFHEGSVGHNGSRGVDYARMKAIVLLETLSEYTARARLDESVAPAPVHEFLTEFRHRWKNTVTKFLDEAIGRVLDRFQPIVDEYTKPAGRNTTSTRAEERPQALHDLGVIAESLARAVLSGLHRAERGPFTLMAFGGRHTVPFPPGSQVPGSIDFTLLFAGGTQVADVVLKVGGSQCRLTAQEDQTGPQSLSIGSRTTIARVADYIKWQTQDSECKGEALPVLKALAEQQELLPNIIKDAFDLYINEQNRALQKEKELFYETFEKEFPEDTMEYYVTQLR